MVRVIVGNNTSRKAVIVDNTATLKEACEQAGFDYTKGGMMLDGATLGAGDMNKTFADFGVVDTCNLISVAKVDNAVKVTVAGDAAVVTSEASFEELKNVEKYNPEALKIYEGEGKDRELVFVVGTTVPGHGSIGTYGVSFDAKSRDNAKKAQLTISVAGAPDDVKKYISDKYGKALSSLKLVEAGLPGAIAKIAEEQAAIQALVEVAQ